VPDSLSKTEFRALVARHGKGSSQLESKTERKAKNKEAKIKGKKIKGPKASKQRQRHVGESVA